MDKIIKMVIRHPLCFLFTAISVIPYWLSFVILSKTPTKIAVLGLSGIIFYAILFAAIVICLWWATSYLVNNLLLYKHNISKSKITFNEKYGSWIFNITI